MSCPARDAAAAYQARGWHAVRLEPLSKRSKRQGWQETPDPPEAFGLGDNIGVGLGRVSGGLVDVDLDCTEAVGVAPLFLPPTATFGRASRPRAHWLYQVTGDVDSIPRTRRWNEAHVELRGTGGQTMAPPSVRGWQKGDPPDYQPEAVAWYDRLPLAVIDAAELRALVVRVGVASILRQAWPGLPGGVHDTCLALGGLFRRSGWPEEQALAIVDAAVGLDADPHRATAISNTYAKAAEEPTTGFPTLVRLIGEKRAVELRKLVTDKALGFAAPEPQLEAGGHALNDLGNAERLLERFGVDLRYAEGVGWLRWAGTRWIVDAAGPWTEAETIADDLARTPGEQGKRLRAHGVTSGNVARLKAMIEVASRRPGVRVSAEELDADPWLLGTPSGVLDLRTGVLREPAREDLITCQTSAPYDPHATCPRFDRFLVEVMGGDCELAAYLVRWMGYSLTGDTSEHAFQLWHGAAGRNGKSTLAETLLAVWGDYGTTIATEILLQHRGGSAPHPTGMMDLRGRRLAVAHELPSGAPWNSATIKNLTGGDTIVARAMRRDFVRFPPTHHLVMTANARPIARDPSSAFWARVHLVPWEVSFLGREDPDLARELLAEAPGILARAVQGCGEWIGQARKLRPPQAVRAATDDYRDSMDTLASFLEDELVIGEAHETPRTAVYRAYADWAMAHGEPVDPASVFYRKIVERSGGSITAVKRSGARLLRGCSLAKKGLALVAPRP